MWRARDWYTRYTEVLVEGHSDAFGVQAVLADSWSKRAYTGEHTGKHMELVDRSDTDRRVAERSGTRRVEVV